MDVVARLVPLLTSLSSSSVGAGRGASAVGVVEFDRAAFGLPVSLSFVTPSDDGMGTTIGMTFGFRRATVASFAFDVGGDGGAALASSDWQLTGAPLPAKDASTASSSAWSPRLLATNLAVYAMGAFDLLHPVPPTPPSKGGVTRLGSAPTMRCSTRLVCAARFNSLRLRSSR